MKNIFIILLCLTFLNVSAIGVHDTHNEEKTKIVQIEKPSIYLVQENISNMEVLIPISINDSLSHCSPIDSVSLSKIAFAKEILNVFFIKTNRLIDVGKNSKYNFKYRYLGTETNQNLIKTNTEKTRINIRSVIPLNSYLSIANNTSYRS